MASAIYIDCLSFLSTEDALSLSAKYKIVDRLSFDPDVTVAVIRPPQVYCPDFLSFFPNLTTILSDTTGVSHLSQAFLNPNLKIFTLRDLKSSDRDDLTAASELALLLISLSLRPVIKCHQQLLSSIPSQSDCSTIFSERSSYIGLTWQDVRLGFIGAGRIANSVASSIPSYVGSLSFYDPFINPSDSFYCGLRVDSLDELFRQSNVILLSATDDPKNLDLVDQVLLRHRLHSFINISRPYMVNSASLLTSFRLGNLKHYYSDFAPPDISPSELSPLVHDGSILFLPHIGGVTHHSWRNSLRKILTFLPS